MKLGKAIRLLKEPRHWAPLLRGVAAAVEHPHLKVLCGDVRTVVDIGANRGQFALMARHCFPLARIVAFEPLARPADQFKRVFNGDKNVTLHRVAIGTHAHEAAIHLSARDDSSSLLPILDLQDDIFPGTKEVGTLKVTVAPLNQYLGPADIQSPALLKLDVQGYELKVLEGCQQLLSSFDHVYLELSFMELYQGQALAYQIIDYLRMQHFELCGAYNLTYDAAGRSVQGDFLFARRSF